MITHKGGNHPVSLNYCFHFIFGFLEKLKLDVSLKKKRNKSVSISILFEEKGNIYSYFFLLFSPSSIIAEKHLFGSREKKIKRNKDLLVIILFFFLEN